MGTNQSLQYQSASILPGKEGHHPTTNVAARARTALSDLLKAIWVQQVLHTILVLLVTFAMWVPMLAVQTVLKNSAIAHIRAPRPDLADLNRTLPDVLLDNWPPHQFCIINYITTTQLVRILE